jgi:hypothetical protein
MSQPDANQHFLDMSEWWSLGAELHRGLHEQASEYACRALKSGRAVIHSLNDMRAHDGTAAYGFRNSATERLS